MVRQSFSMFCLAALVAWGAGAAETGVPAPLDNLPFTVGEELVYRIYWGVMPVGESVVTTRWEEHRGLKMIGIRFRTRTNKFMERLYPVDDVIETLVYPDTFLPERFTKKLSEGRYRCHEVTTFDHSGGVAHWRSELSGRAKDYPIEPDTRDIVSFMYYARTMEFQPGDEKNFRVMADEKVYDVFVKVTGKEDVRTADGKLVPSVILEPEAAFEGLFVRKGKMWLWISRQTPSVVTRLAARVPVASIKLLLAESRVPDGAEAAVRPEEEPPEP
ncbi:MAG: DUF3108 domain-containing protein [Kiritimatiellae bacterium]|nr:DUF3108 domain-containing protein [Kiritimatiellia bacterium]